MVSVRGYEGWRGWRVVDGGAAVAGHLVGYGRAGPCGGAAWWRGRHHRGSTAGGCRSAGAGFAPARCIWSGPTGLAASIRCWRGVRIGAPVCARHARTCMPPTPGSWSPAGVCGGRHGMPDTVGSHPAVFVTVTAPSFGAVHGARAGASAAARRCHPPGPVGHGDDRRTAGESSRGSGQPRFTVNATMVVMWWASVGGVTTTPGMCCSPGGRRSCGGALRLRCAGVARGITPPR